jgi:rhamnosyltransferase
MQDYPRNAEPHDPAVRRVVAVVVTFHPDPQELRAMLQALLPQVHGVWLVDNGSHETDLESLCSGLAGGAPQVLRLGENRGVARAHNEGIRMARRAGASHVLLMDQDSVPAPDMVHCLLEACERLGDVASVGPYYRDPRLPAHTPFIQVRGLRLRRWYCNGSDAVFQVDHVISSGSLIPMSAIDILGEMREDLFIDAVDIEWGLRARRHGLRNYGVCKATMRHNLGDDILVIFGRIISRHPPHRLYYQFRNAMLLCRERNIPLNWKLVYLKQVFLRYAIYVWCARPLGPYLRMMSLGIVHGIRGVSGPCVNVVPRS